MDAKGTGSAAVPGRPKKVSYPRRASRLQRFRAIHDALAADHPVAKIATWILREVALLVRTPLPVHLLQLNQGGDALCLTLSQASDGLAVDPGRELAMRPEPPMLRGASLAPALRDALAAGELYICPASAGILAGGALPPFLEDSLPGGEAWLLALPIHLAGRLGALVLAPLPRPNLSRAQADGLALLSGQLAVALRHEELLAASQDAHEVTGAELQPATERPPRRKLEEWAAGLAAANRRLHTLHGAALALLRELDLERVKQAIVVQASAILKPDVVALLVPASGLPEYEIGAAHGLAAPAADRLRVTAADVRAVAEHTAGSISVTRARRKAPRWERRLLAAGRCTFLAAVPLQRSGQVAGLLALLYKAEDAALSPEERELAVALGELATAALLNAVQHRETEYGTAESTFLLQLSQLLSSTFDVTAIAQMVVEEAGDLMESDTCALYLYDAVADEIELRVVQSGSRKRPRDPRFRRLSLDRVPAAREAAIEGQPLASTWPGEGDLLAFLGPAYRVQVSLTVPLRARGSLLGMLFLGRRALRRYNLGEIQLGHKLGTLAALALDNARLYADLSDQMRQLQGAQAQLIEAEKMASLGRIVAGVAHALNNPLAVISGYAQVLLDGDTPPEVRADLERIDRGAHRAAEVVRELLAFARQRPLLPTSIDVADLVHSALEQEAAALREAGIAIKVEIEEGMPPVHGDRNQLEQMLAHLIANARQAIASRRGAGRLAVGAWYRDAVQLTVADDGPGIPPDLLDKVFEPFLTTREVGQGMGLGLSVCYGIVRAHGGRIWATNTPPVGAAIHVELPAAEP
jgi:signal transduction histidine kinase